MVKADLHNHLRTSSRYFEGDFDKAVDTASRKLGEGAVLGVVNFSDWRYEHLTDLRGYERENLGGNKNGVYVPEKDIYIVKGQEVPTKEGHLLVFGTGARVHLREGRKLEDTIKEARDQNGIIVVDHPFHVAGLGNYLEQNPETLGQVDAIEIHNGEASFGLPVGPIPFGANKKAQEFYARFKPDFPNLGAISSSDGHSMYELGSSWTEIERPTNEDFVNSLRESVRRTGLSTQRKMKSSVFGAIDHIADLALITQIGFRVGLKDFYCGTDRPE